MLPTHRRGKPSEIQPRCHGAGCEESLHHEHAAGGQGKDPSTRDGSRGVIRWLKGREAGVGAEQGRRTSLLPACSQPSSSPELPSRGCLDGVRAARAQGPHCRAHCSCTDGPGSLQRSERKPPNPSALQGRLQPPFGGKGSGDCPELLSLVFKTRESTLNTDSCLKPGVTYVVTSASYCCKTVKTTISSIFNSGKMVFFLV